MAENSDDGWGDAKAREEFDEIFGPVKQEVRPEPVPGKEVQDPLRSIKIKISSLLVGEQELLHAREIAMKFYETYEAEINPIEYGDFVGLDDLLLAMPDKIKCFERDGYYLYRAKNTDRVADIRSLVARQMTKEDIHAKRMQKRSGWGANRSPPLPATTRISHIDVVDQKQNAIEQLVAKKYSSTERVDSTSVRAAINASREKNKETPYRITDWDAPLHQKTSLQPQVGFALGKSQLRDFVNQSAEQPVNSEDLVKAYFTEYGKEVSMSQLPAELVQIIFQHSQSFCHSARPGSEEDLHLISMVRPLSTSKKNTLKVKAATETNLAWVGHAPFILELCKFTKVSVLYMMSKKSLLVSTFWGNEKGGRFLLINQYIYNINAKCRLRNVPVLIPGQMYVIKSGDEYARGILLSEASTPGKYLFACVDFNATFEISMRDIFDLPVALYLNKLPGNVFLARLRGIESIKAEHVASFNSRIVQIDTWKKPIATCVIYDFMCVKNNIHVACIDLIVPYKGGYDWLSKLLINEGMVVEKRDDHPPIDKLIAHGTILAMEKVNAFSMRDSDIWSSAKPSQLYDIGHKYPGFEKIIGMIYQPSPCLPIPKTQRENTPKKADIGLEEGKICDASVSSICALTPIPLSQTKIHEHQAGHTNFSVMETSNADQVKYSRLLREIAQQTLLCVAKENSDHEVLLHKILDFVATLQLVLPLSEIDKDEMDSLVADLYNSL